MGSSSEISVLEKSDPQYPPLLKEIHDAPTRLYVRGNTSILSAPTTLAVVGSRKADTYARQIASTILPPLLQKQVVIVSGLAYGADTIAHRASVDNKQPTIAVLGCGVDDQTIYPRTNLPLAQQILEHNGAIVSEYPPTTTPRKEHFPARNRIIAGLARATLLLQAAIRSGSLITARLALESNRDVLAVPGNITNPLSAGTNLLIQQGAVAVQSADDIADALGIQLPTQAEYTKA